MKKLILSLLIAASSSSAFAFHPEDSDLVKDIGIGSQMIVTSDLNIKPNHRFIYGEGLRCWIALAESQPYDQVLKAGTVFTIKSVERTTYEIGYEILKVDNPKVRGLRCKKNATIGTLKQEFRYNFRIKLATPKEF